MIGAFLTRNWLFFATFVLAVQQFGCSNTVVLSSTVETEFGWRGPFVADVEALGGTANTAGDCGFAGVGTPAQSFGDFSIVASSTAAYAVTSVCSGTGEKKVMIRRYQPVSQGGEGWDTASPGVALSSAIAALSGNGVAALDADGTPFASFWEAADADGLGATFSATSGWADITMAAAGSNNPPAYSSGPAARSACARGVPGNESTPTAAPQTQNDGKFGGGWFSFIDGAGAVVFRTLTESGWAEDPDVTLGSDALRVRMVSDGFGATAVWASNPGAAGRYELETAWSGETDADSVHLNFGAGTTESKLIDGTAGWSHGFTIDNQAPNFGLAADSHGNAVVLSYGTDPSLSTTQCSIVTNCRIRLFAWTRGVNNTWLGPTRVDENLLATSASTSFYQDSDAAAQGGIDYATPSIAYLGDGRFLAAFAVTDFSSPSAPYTRVFTRGYTAGRGWDAVGSIELVLSLPLEDVSGVFAAYRRITDHTIVTDGAGGATLLAHAIVAKTGETSHAAVADRATTPMVLPLIGPAYDASSEAVTFTGMTPCPLTTDGCNGPMIDGALFSSGETVVLAPGPVSSTNDAELRLYSLEYRKE